MIDDAWHTVPVAWTYQEEVDDALLCSQAHVILDEHEEMEQDDPAFALVLSPYVRVSSSIF